jgi:hypothetical protein
MPNPRLPLLFVVGLCLLSGCTTGSYWVNVPVSGGDTVPLELIPGGVRNAENDDFKIDAAVMQFDPKVKSATYLLAFEVKRGAAPRSVKVEDISDEAPATLFQTDQVKLEKDLWKVRTASFVPDQQNSKWIYQIENTIRVCRFTIVTADGRSEVLNQGCNYYPFIKDMIRQSLEPAKAGATAPAAAP